eukprot:TRINITY_DN11566_c0_g1_i2.p1 TRINITY_DN11566_c0_g1~~TRINITY_DN11566_c0_g1_i2.p1  ORF type:complete len:731 (+),score=270.76 TRINITY_DN11566_c0_g1_i2:89-2194(+)
MCIRDRHGDTYKHRNQRRSCKTLFNHMEEILALQRKLAEVQETSNLHRLSDRNIVEIMDKIMKNYDLKLLYTEDGKEYLTPDYLERQIRDVVVLKGRLNIVELPKNLGVSIEKIDPRIENVCSRFSEVQCKDGHIFTVSYIDNLCEELNEELQQRNQINLSELTVKFNFPKKYIASFIEARLGTIIQGTLSSDRETLFTLSFQQIMRAKVRGILRGCIRPIQLAQLAKMYLLDENTLAGLVDQLIKSEEIDGKVLNGMYISNRFLKNQEVIVSTFFKQNDYIEYDLLQKQLYITRPKEFLKNMFKDSCIFLENLCYNKDSLINLNEQVTTILNLEGYVNLNDMLPSVLSEEDVETLVNKHMQLKNVEMLQNIVFGNDYLEKLVQKFRDKIVSMIYKSPQLVITESVSEDTGSKKGKKGSKKKDESNDPFGKETVIGFLKENKLIEFQEDAEFEECLVKLLRPRMIRFYEEIKKELFENKKSASSELISEIQNKIEDKILAITLYQRTIGQIENTMTNVETSFLSERTLAYSRHVIENLLFIYSKKYGVALPPRVFSKSLEESKTSDSTTAKEEEYFDYFRGGKFIFKDQDAINQAIDLLPKEQQKLLKEFNDCYGKKKVSEILNFLEKRAGDLGVRMTLDKKTEKNFIYGQKYFCKEIVKANKSDGKMILYAVGCQQLADQGLVFCLPFEDKSIMLLLSRP